MTTDLQYLAGSTVLTFVMLLSASLIRARGWTVSGTLLAMRNRDDLPEHTPLSARADRAGKNMLEGLAMFTAALVVARLGGAEPTSIAQGAAIFFWARVAYWFVYLAGIPYLRTAVWAVGVYGTVMILRAAY